MTVLKDTSLCAIVRDEKMNPAGGVERFLRCHLPYVEEAVVVDTGSTDGTRDVLDQMTREFAHLKVYDSVFRSYAHARNVSLKKVKTKWAFVLDVDELVEPASFDIIEEDKEIVKWHTFGFNFAIRDIVPEERPSEPAYFGLHNPRLFNTQKGFQYRLSDNHCEWLYVPDEGNMVIDTGKVHRISSIAPILHFRSFNNGRYFKSSKWYAHLNELITEQTGPAQTPGFKEWKQLNPHRKNYAG